MSKRWNVSVREAEWLLSAMRGFRNGIITGARIRTPYLFQALGYAVLFQESSKHIKLVLKQLFIHGKNLGLFVFFYKSLCSLCRNLGITGGVESWIAGFIGGYWAFGDNQGISGSVNNQICLYLFARGIQGAWLSGVQRNIIPQQLDISKPQGFRYFAGLSLALILYLTEYEPKTLNSGFIRTMDYLYYKSNSGVILSQQDYKFLPFILVGLISLAYPFVPQLGLEQMLNKVLGK